MTEIDESLLAKNINNRGTILSSQIWIFGCLKRGKTDDCFIEKIECRDRPILTEIIRKIIKPGSLIAGDQLISYRKLTRLMPDISLAD